jgi:hypothetical protein
MTSTLEILVDAIAHLNRAHEPESAAYRLRNPLLLRSFARPGKHELDEEGRRVFPSFINGYKASVVDMELKVSGKSRSGIKADDNLRNLLAAYGIRELGGVDQVVKFLRRALKDANISRESHLTIFTTNKESR